MLREITILYGFKREPIKPNFKNIYCPNLQKVKLDTSIEGEITDFLTTTQLAQLKLFHGDGILVRDLTLLPQAEDLCVEYDQRLTRHSVLPSKLVRLFIYSWDPVDGIPSQLEYFGLSNDLEEVFTEVDSTTLKELNVFSYGSVSIN
ncbi:hypothetical protein DIRU0_B08086 [Diutina rugosa]